MHSNGLLKWLMIPVVLLLVFVGIRMFEGRSVEKLPSTISANSLTPTEMKALGVEGDSPRDTVATLVAQVKQLRNELQTALTDNKNQKAENERLRQRESAIDQRIQHALDNERGRLQQDRDQAAGDRQQTQSLLQEVQRRLDGLGGKDNNQIDLPVGLGLPEGDGNQFDNGVRWIEPSGPTFKVDKDRRNNHEKSAGTTTGIGLAQNPTDSIGEKIADTSRGVIGKSAVRPVYTVPANATLMGSIAMTALIGRIPVDGTVNDPYPFKVLIGPDNLTANGIEIPDVAGAVISGTASGDWTLSCVRGQIRSVTFVFRDGTIRTLPKDRGENGENNTDNANSQNSNGSNHQGLGWISDSYGIPCVTGERRSNAQQYLGTQALITAAGAGAASLIPSDKNNLAVVSDANGSLGTVGISHNEAMGRILAGGVQDMSQWVNKLYGQAFAAVYVEPGAQVAVHLEQPLTIDYDIKGRRVNHQLGGSYVPDLD